MVESSLVNLKVESESIVLMSYKFRWFYSYEFKNDEKSDYMLFFKLNDESNDKEWLSLFCSWTYSTRSYKRIATIRSVKLIIFIISKFRIFKVICAFIVTSKFLSQISIDVSHNADRKTMLIHYVVLCHLYWYEIFLSLLCICLVSSLKHYWLIPFNFNAL